MAIKIQENISLSPYTVIKVGGPARYFVEVKNVEELQEVIQFATQKKLALFVLGAGSNILISDQGFSGLVAHMKNDSVRIEEEKVFVGAGVMMPRLAMETAKAGLSGLEWGTGVPGTVGGSIRGNAGCFGGEVKDTLECARILKFSILNSQFSNNSKFSNFQITELNNNECEFDYRASVFKKHPEWIIVDAVFKLKKTDPAAVQNLFEEIKKKSEMRVVEQPIGEKTMGSTFKGVPLNDNITANLERINLPWKRGENRRGVLSAGFLIAQAGLGGYKVGGAMVSQKHANFIINTGMATARDVVRLITHIKDTVKETFEIVLEEEIQYVGF